MRLSRTLHGLPKKTKSPFTLNVIDKNGSPVEYYEVGEKYLVRVTGFVHWRGLIFQPRLAHSTGNLIGSLRGGHFEPTRDWDEFVFWVADRDVGPVQFMLTLASENDMYWERWRPRNGFILPIQERENVKKEIDERLFNDQNAEQETDDLKSLDAPQFPPILSEQMNARIERNSSDFQEEIRKWDLGSIDENGNQNQNQKFDAFSSKVANREEDDQKLHRVTAPAWFQLKSDCKQVGCENGGNCIEYVNFGRCNCTIGFTGDRCQEIDYCSSEPCQNGVCLNDPNRKTFLCKCDDNFVGTKCETKCPENFCKQGGKCLESSSGKLRCECPKGIIGENCEREINECNWLRCVHSKECIDMLDDYKCVCNDGWMGKNCDRPCQDVYGTCRIWERDGECQRIAETDFFEYNCAVTCKQCVYKNETIKTDRPIPHILLPLTWLLGKWHVRVKGKSDLPFDFKETGYEETVTFSVSEGLVFGTPAINYTSVAVSLVDPLDQHISNGFLTIQQYPDDLIVRKAALLTTTNLGYHSIEEGILENDENNPDFHRIQFRARYLGLYPEIEEKWPDKMKRTFERKGKKLYQRIAKVRGSKGKKFTKIYTKIEEFLF
ncbi:unnamed protein product, partial [Mesorhabditis belari]|uniref:Uncharacterized protein n=1 Tax=Mesorhabditis belari TaxID=2138241 RepID=A0AAF3EZF5_9BILA